MTNKINPSATQIQHWIDVGRWAKESSDNAGVKKAGQRVLEVARAGGNVEEHCRTAYEIALRVWVR